MFVHREQKYLHNVSNMKIFGYGDYKKIKVTCMATVRNKYVQVDDIVCHERGTANDKKLDNNISRSRSKIQEVAKCNPWDWYVTFTLNKDKQNRADIKLYHKQLTQWLQNYKKKHSCNIKFLLVPELHKDDLNWHMHGLLYGLPIEHLIRFRKGDIMPTKIAEKVNRGEKVYHWLAYDKRFGWNDIEPIRSYEGVTNYLSKYITKELLKNITELNAHLYYRSRGLNTAKVIKEGYSSFMFAPDFQNEYCSLAWFDYSEEVYSTILNSFE